MSILKEEYNVLLKREKAAEHYFNTATGEQVDKWLPKYNEIVVGLSNLIIQVEKEDGRELTSEEILNGF